MFKRFSFVAICVLLCLAWAVSWRSYFSVYVDADTVDVKDFPMEIAGWTAVDLPLTDEEYAILETRNAFVRNYTASDGSVVQLYIIYSQHNRKISHPPELCYTGSGSMVILKEKIALAKTKSNATITAQKIVVDQRGAQQVVVYTFKIGDSFTENYWKQQALIAVKSLLGKKSSSALIRLSAVVPGADVARAEKAIRAFAQKIVPLLPTYLP